MNFSFFPGSTALTAPDFAVVGLLLALMIFLGWRSSGKQATTDDYFLARRKIPGWAACLSFVATEVSAVTIVSVPAIAYMENLQYAQFFIGSALARMAIAYWFIPAFYRFNCTTIYEFLKHRFGMETQVTAVGFFFVTRLLGSGVRLMAASLAVSVLLGWNILYAIILFSVIGLAYITYGGVRAVVWTGVFQAVIFLVAGLSALAFLFFHIPGGLPHLLDVARDGGRLSLFNWGPSWGDPAFFKKFFSDPNILWVAILNGFFGSMAAFGTDQELMQRLLTVETRRESQKTMLWTLVGSFSTLLTYLLIGTCLYVFFTTHPDFPLPQNKDAVFPHFVIHVMPVLLRGLLLAAVVMASIDSPLSSLTSSFVTDLYRPLIRRDQSEAHYLKVARIGVAVFAVILGFIAYAFSFQQKILWLAFKIGGVTFGSLLGVFLLGFLTKRVVNRGNIIAMLLFAVINAVLLVLSEKNIFPLGWSWLVIIGTVGTFTVGYFLGTSQNETDPHPSNP